MELPQEYAERLRTIFDLCDEDKDGYIDVLHFKGLAKDHFGADGLEEITGIINLLDPEGRGIISFHNFCKGVEQIVDIQSQAQSQRLKSSVSEDTLVPLDIAGDLSSLQGQKESPLSQSTFVEYDFDALDEFSGFNANSNSSGDVNHSFTSSVVFLPTSEDEGDSALSGRSSEVNENSRQEITDEENFEDYGEVGSEADVSDQGLDPVTHKHHRDKKISLSSKHPKKICPKRRITTAGLASQLQRSSREVTPNSTRRSSLGSDEIFFDIDGNFQDLNGRVKYLESHLLQLTNNQVETSIRQTRLKEENSILVHKVLTLEELLRDMELRAEEHLKEEHRKHQELMVRQDREKSEQIEYITQRLHRIENEYEELKEEAPRLRSEIAKLRSEKIELQERMLEKQEMYNILHDNHEQLKLDYHKQDDLFQRERCSTGQLLDELGKELEGLRKYKMDVEAGVHSSNDKMIELPGHYQELRHEIHKLKETMWEEWRDLMKENRGLRSSNEDLNVQLMNRCVEEGKSLLKNGGTKSLAQELEQLTKEELMEQIRAEQEFSFRLKQYVDRIIITILEKNPSLLEINK